MRKLRTSQQQGLDGAVNKVPRPVCEIADPICGVLPKAADGPAARLRWSCELCGRFCWGQVKFRSVLVQRAALRGADIPTPWSAQRSNRMTHPGAYKGGKGGAPSREAPRPYVSTHVRSLGLHGQQVELEEVELEEVEPEEDAPRCRWTAFR